MWTYNETVKYLKNINISVYRALKVESENIYILSVIIFVMYKLSILKGLKKHNSFI